MGKELLLTKSNFRKTKTNAIGIFLLMIIASALSCVSLLLFLDTYPTVEKEAKRLDAGDGFIWLDNDISKVDDTYFDNLFDGAVEWYEHYDCLGYNAVSIPFGNGTVSPAVLIGNDIVFQQKKNRTEIVDEDPSITKNYIYLPYQFHTGSGYNTGEKYEFELAGTKYSYTIKGFLITTYMGCTNTGTFEFVLDNESYDVIYEKDSSYHKSICLSFKLKDGEKDTKFRNRVEKDIRKINPDTGVYVGLFSDVKFGRSFMSLIIAVSFLIITTILIVVVIMMIGNCVSNYIKENMKMIGAMKAIGYTGNNIKQSLHLLFDSLSVVGGMIGIGVAYLIMPSVAKIVVSQMGLEYKISFLPICVILPVVVELLFVMISTGVAGRNISKIEAIVALRDGMQSHNFKKNPVRLDRSIFGLNMSLALKTFLHNRKQNIITFIVTGLLVFICVIGLLMFENFNRNPIVEIFTFETGSGEVGVESSVKKETLEYLESRDDVKNIRCFYNIYFNYGEEDRLTGYIFDDVDKMNNKNVCYKGRLPKYDNEIAVSGKFARDYGIQIGDEAAFSYGNKTYSYLVTGLVQTCNNYGKEFVMSTEAAEHMVDFTDKGGHFFYDCENREVAQQILDDCTKKFGNAVYSTVNFYDALEGNITMFKKVTTGMMVGVCVIAGIVITLILYLLMKSFIYNKRKDYGVYKALGYTSGSLMLQTALGFMPAIVLSVIVSSIVSYFVANPYMSTVMSSFGLMKCDFKIPVFGVVIIGICMIVVSFVIAIFQSRKIRKIEAYQMLVGE